jgi:hypothetical protein
LRSPRQAINFKKKHEYDVHTTAFIKKNALQKDSAKKKTE